MEVGNLSSVTQLVSGFGGPRESALAVSSVPCSVTTHITAFHSVTHRVSVTYMKGFPTGHACFRCDHTLLGCTGEERGTTQAATLTLLRWSGVLLILGRSNWKQRSETNRLCVLSWVSTQE